MKVIVEVEDRDHVDARNQQRRRIARRVQHVELIAQRVDRHRELLVGHARDPIRRGDRAANLAKPRIRELERAAVLAVRIHDVLVVAGKPLQCAHERAQIGLGTADLAGIKNNVLIPIFTGRMYHDLGADL